MLNLYALLMQLVLIRLKDHRGFYKYVNHSITMAEIGFDTQDKNTDKDVYQQYIGCPGHYGCGAVTVTGVLKEINIKEGYLSVQPSLVGHGSSVRLEKNRPTLITLVPGNPLSLRPLENGDLDKIVENHEGIKTTKIIET